MSTDIPRTSKMLYGEGDRSLEFKTSRDKLAADVNSWLADLAKVQSGGGALPDGTVMVAEPRVVRTLLGANRGNQLMAENMEPGVSLQGDSVSTPIKLQSVRVNNGETEVIEAQGTEPFIAAMGGGYSSDYRNETVAAFGVRTLDDVGATYFTYSIRGDGAVERGYYALDGYHTTTLLTKPEDIALAQEAFDEVKQSFV